jgi:hypothetical protein
MSNHLDPKKVLLHLRGLTNTTGSVHELQVAQFKHWGILNFKGEFRLGYSADSKVVEYKGQLEPGSHDVRCAVLDKWVKEMMGDDWYVKVVDPKDKVIFVGTPVPQKRMRWTSSTGPNGNLAFTATPINPPTQAEPQCQTPPLKKTPKPRKKKRASRKR